MTYKTLVVKIEIQKGTEKDQKAVIYGFFFRKLEKKSDLAKKNPNYLRFGPFLCPSEVLSPLPMLHRKYYRSNTIPSIFQEKKFILKRITSSK